MKIEKEVGLISKMPGIFPFVNIFKKIRKCVVVKQVSLYYAEVEINHQIFILRLLSNSLGPESIEKELSNL
jgi:hypothetical protein